MTNTSYLHLKTAAILVVSMLFSCTKTDFKDSASLLRADNASIESLERANNKKPNIILILSDDIGYEVPTVNGGESYSTPTIDKLTRLGMQFTQCHSSPLCSPSRTALLTGKYNFRNYFTWGSLPVTEKTIGNMMENAGYKTCVAGKWQFDGGAQSIAAFGFQKYCVWDAFSVSKEEEDGDIGSMYKNPKIYQNGAFLPESATNGKYGEDFFNQYVRDFIDSNKKKPFFIYYPMVLCHAPFSPTPDDAAFATWNPAKDKSDTAWFPSMVKYMDKKINDIITKVEEDGLSNKTVILFIGDNGTPGPIYSKYKGMLVQGGKSKTNEWGTHVPLIVYSPGHVKKGIVKDLISFPDFLPTIADIANIAQPKNFGTIDGVSFYNQIAGHRAVPRDWIYNNYNPHPDQNAANTSIWVQDTTNKLYNGKQSNFYDIVTDVNEKKPISNSKLTPQQAQTKTEFQAIIDSIH